MAEETLHYDRAGGKEKPSHRESKAQDRFFIKFFLMDKRSFSNISEAKNVCASVCICVRESLLMRVCSGKSTFVTFKCTKALPRHHYAFNLTVQQSACSSVVMLPVQLSTSTSLLTALTLCRHILVSLLFFSAFQ